MRRAARGALWGLLLAACWACGAAQLVDSTRPLNVPTNTERSIAALASDVVFGVFFLLLFLVLRMRYIRVFEPRDFHGAGGVATSRRLFSVVKILYASDEAFFRSAGPDVFMHSVFLRSATAACLAMGLLGALLLFPVNATDDYPVDQRDPPVGEAGTILEYVSIWRVWDGSPRFTAHVLSIFINAAIVCYVLHKDYGTYVWTRLRVCTEPRPQNYAVLLTGVPSERTDSELRDGLNALLQGSCTGVERVYKDPRAAPAAVRGPLSPHGQQPPSPPGADPAGGAPDTPEAAGDPLAPRAAAPAPGSSADGLRKRRPRFTKARRALESLAIQGAPRGKGAPGPGPRSLSSLRSSFRGSFGSSRVSSGPKASAADLALAAAEAAVHVPDNVTDVELPGLAGARLAAFRAPDPRDLMWGELARGRGHRLANAARTLLLAAAVLALALAWAVPVVTLQDLAYSPFEPELERPLHQAPFPVAAWVEGFVAVTIVALLGQALSPLVQALAAASRLWSATGRQLFLLSRLFFCRVICLFLAQAVVGSLERRLGESVRQPKEWPRFFATYIPARSDFFMTYLMLTGWTGNALLLLTPLAQRLLRRARRRLGLHPVLRLAALDGPGGPGGPSDGLGPGAAPYEGWLSHDVFVLFVALVYSTIQPLMCVVGATHFALGYAVLRYQGACLYTPRHCSEARLWRSAYGSAVFSLAFYMLLSLAFFVEAAFVPGYALCAAGIGATGIFYVWSTSRWERHFRERIGEACAAADEVYRGAYEPPADAFVQPERRRPWLGAGLRRGSTASVGSAGDVGLGGAFGGRASAPSSNFM
eukprot:tig00020816_g14128.t1